MVLPPFLWLWRIFLIVAVLHIAVFLPSVGVFKLESLAALGNACKHLLSNVFFLMEKGAIMLATYCSEDLGGDLRRIVHSLSYLGKTTGQYFSPVYLQLLGNIGETFFAVHKNGMAYTEDFLIQLLGAQGRLLPDDGDSPRNRLISLVLFVLWLIMGLIFISRLSYNKFFILMAGAFLIHAIFGPVWCLKQIAFGIGICLWVGSLVANKPIPAALAVLLLFSITGIRKWQTRSAQARSQTELLQSNKSIEQRIENIERNLNTVQEKLDALLQQSQ